MIFEAQPDDIDELYELWRLLLDMQQTYHVVFRYRPGSEQALKAELLQRLKDKSTRVFVYQEGDTWVGMLLASLRPGSAGFRLSSKGYIGETVVREEFRGKGIGKELFEAARKWLSDQGADHLELQVSVHNPQGIHFWESLGFTPSTQHMVLPLQAPGNSKKTK
ncbi:GNAT family N-acetyltransferase [Pontibacter ramchanderi]|uniref:GNAT family acetyltransferase n=1 Tax=Pontibacter ramchanderi TaxID=1179743 RepID=A0A2N3V3U3_9BACT|nr:GNAT family N-acetyltransferase [Pontibacter ramchanderi]PKV76292.1 GNAT family acetyltransferase [Pontibacter ramchanderi]